MGISKCARAVAATVLAAAAAAVGKGSVSVEHVAGWGGYGSGDGRFYWPCGVAVGADGVIYVADTMNGRVQTMGQEGGFRELAYGSGGIGRPTAVAVDEGETVYVGDAGGECVWVYKSGENAPSLWGGYGYGPGRFCGIGAIAWASGRLFVPERYNRRVQLLDGSGAPQGELTPPPGGWGAPTAVAASGPTLYVADGRAAVVYEYRLTNDRVYEFAAVYDAPGKDVVSMACLKDGSLVAAGAGEEGVFVRREGRWERLPLGKVYNPRGVAAGADGTLFVADAGADRVECYRVEFR